MKISELIKILQNAKDDYGDIRVTIINDYEVKPLIEYDILNIEIDNESVTLYNC